MNSQESSIFFKELKETCRRIDLDVSDVKKRLAEAPYSNNEIAAERIVVYQDKVKTLKTQANDLKYFLEPKLKHTKEFIRNFKELISETEIQVAKQEEYLKQYSYKPLESVQVTPSDADMSPVKQTTEALKNASTPTLLDFGIVKFSNKKSSIDDLTFPPALRNPVENGEHSGSTPTLEIPSLLEMKKETPPMPEYMPTIVLHPSTPKLQL